MAPIHPPRPKTLGERVHDVEVDCGDLRHQVGLQGQDIIKILSFLHGTGAKLPEMNSYRPPMDSETEFSIHPARGSYRVLFKGLTPWAQVVIVLFLCLTVSLVVAIACSRTPAQSSESSPGRIVSTEEH